MTTEGEMISHLFFFRFQYILSAATSPATKLNEETLTYLNQGQSYEVKLKTYGTATVIKPKTLTVRRKIVTDYNFGICLQNVDIFSYIKC